MNNYFDTLALEIKWRIHDFLAVYDEQYYNTHVRYSNSHSRNTHQYLSVRQLRLINKRNARDFAPILGQLMEPQAIVILNAFGQEQIDWLSQSALAPFITKLYFAEVYLKHQAILLGAVDRDHGCCPLYESKDLMKAAPYEHALADRIREYDVTRRQAQHRYRKEVLQLWNVRDLKRNERKDALAIETPSEEMLDQFARILFGFEEVQVIGTILVTKTLAGWRSEDEEVEVKLPTIYSKANWITQNRYWWEGSTPDLSYQPLVSAVTNMSKIASRLLKISPNFGANVEKLKLWTRSIGHSLPTQEQVYDMLELCPNVQALLLTSRSADKRLHPMELLRYSLNHDSRKLASLFVKATNSNPLKRLQMLGLYAPAEPEDATTLMRRHKATLKYIEVENQDMDSYRSFYLRTTGESPCPLSQRLARHPNLKVFLS